MTDPVNDVLSVVRDHYADFRGRTGRRVYWSYALATGLISVVLRLLLSLVTGQSLLPGAPERPLGDDVSLPLVFGVALVAVLFSLALLVPGLAVGARRLHDTGRSGWFLLLGLIPLVGGLVLIVLMVAESQPDANRWGPGPVDAPPPAFDRMKS